MKTSIESNLRKWSALGALVSCLLGAASGHAATLYVATDSPADGPGTTWATAFHTIQGAVNVATNGDTVWVTNGVYASGGVLTPGYSLSNRVYITQAITLQSVNGPANTFIVGAADPASTNGPAAVRCVYLVTNAIVSGFTLTNGHTLTTENYNYNDSGAGAFLDHGGTVSNCVLTGCSSYGPGSGAYLYHAGTVNNCTFTGNAGGAQSAGGGAYLDKGGTLNNCLLSGNSTYYRGGGAQCNEGGTLNNCTVVGNRVKYYDGGGVYCANSGTLNNCIVYSNTPGGNDNIWGGYTARYTCAPGLSGNGCITNDPQFVNAPAGDYRLAGTSPCVNTGTNGDWTSGMTDLDGNPRTFGGKADMGAYELIASAVTYVALNGSHTWPYATWSTAATNIQGAVDAVADNGTIWVTNGVYATGGAPNGSPAMSNRVCITNDITLQSVNGPSVTVIKGAPDAATGGLGTNATRCVFMSAGFLAGFTLTNGYTRTDADWNTQQGGGGALLRGGVISNCVVTACVSSHFAGGLDLFGGDAWNCLIFGNSSYDGGGLVLQGSEAFNCLVRNNRASNRGGGVFFWQSGTLGSCTVAGNSATNAGGGAYFYQGGVSRNTIIYFNTTNGVANNWTTNGSGSSFVNNCTTPALPGDVRIVTDDPRLMNLAAGDCRLKPGSPCIDDAQNHLASGANDLAGNPRIINYTVDIGAYEYTFPSLTITNSVTSVATNQESIVLGGTSAYLTGLITYANAASGASGSLPAQAVWTTPEIPLLYGPNQINVTGTNYGGAVASSSITITRQSPPAPFVDLTNQAASVVYSVPNYPIGGTNNAYVVGTMWWTNSATGASGTFAANSPWQVTGIALAVGANSITVYGTNQIGVVSSDSVVITGTLPLATYVAMGGSNVPPYETWANAATTIQAAVDMTAPGGTVWVSNGVYAAGGKVTPGKTLFNRVCLTADITVQSLNGPTNTIIVGAGPRGASAVRGAYLSAGVLSGFTLTNGNTLSTSGFGFLLGRSGGGAFLDNGGTLSNCIVTGSSATEFGGGVCLNLAGTLNDSTIQGNSTSGGTESNGGGGGVACVQGGVVNRCLISGNTATKSTAGGGVGGGVLLENGAACNSCIISNNSASINGGGGVELAGGGRLNNSTICRNTTGGGGGGVQFENNGGAANNCLVYANTAGDRGGGAYLNAGGVMNNCTLAGNTSTLDSDDGGGAWLTDGGTLNNCIVSGNTQDGAWNIGVSGAGTTVRYTCSPGLSGSGNLTNAPLFVNAAANNYRLLAGSPCIDAGTNEAWMTSAVDLDGNPRLVGANVDMGAYEAPSYTASGILIAWLRQYGLATDGSADALDPDTDGCNNRQEYIADTNPTNAASYFHIESVTHLPPLTVRFLSSASRVYSLCAATNLDNAPWTVIAGQSNVMGTGGSMSLRDTNAAAASFYRVQVALP